MDPSFAYTAFLGTTKVVSGDLPAVLSGLKPIFETAPGASLLVFEDQTGRQVDFDLRGTLAEVVARATPAPPRTGPGRPKLGVVAREISLLPRHWEWLEKQPSGASAAIRKLVDAARVEHEAEDKTRTGLAATNRFLTAMAGNLAGYEEATRALFARDRVRFVEQVAEWPADIRDYALQLSAEPA